MDVRIEYKYENREVRFTEKQLKVLNSPANTLIEGIAGSGKTLLAILLAEKLIKEGYSVAVIVFTKALSKFITDKISFSIDIENLLISYEYQWKENKENYDYIIIDEFQDFSLETIIDFKRYANNGIYLFGDFNQKLYYEEIENSRPTISKEDISKLDIKYTIKLNENYRVPNNIVFLLNDLYLKLSNLGNKYIESSHSKKDLTKSNKKNDFKSYFHQFDSHEEEIKFIANLINDEKLRGKSIGILLNLNGDKEQLYKSFDEVFGFNNDQNLEKIINIKDLAKKLSIQTNKKIGYKMRYESHLDFVSNESINILTIHSSKGLEFDIVILPFIKANQDFVSPNSIYVAMTRCKEQLIVTYSGYIQNQMSFLNKNLINGVINILPDMQD